MFGAGLRALGLDRKAKKTKVNIKQEKISIFLNKITVIFHKKSREKSRLFMNSNINKLK